MKRTLRLKIETPKRRKARPRGDPSALIPYQFKKGRVAPPTAGNKRKKPDLIAKAYKIELDRPAPTEVAEVLGLGDCTWAEAIAFAMVRRAASGDIAAAKEIREVTEGRLPYALAADADVINYNLGKSPKDVLLGRLLPRRGTDRE